MKIFCIGRNYPEHARELGNPAPEKPLIFMKPPTALLVNNKPFFYPDFSRDIHYEAEIVLQICKNGKHVEKAFAPTYYNAVAIGIDFTARDIQQECKKNGHPWEIAKGFDNSAPVSAFIPIETAMSGGSIRFHLNKNGETVQQGDTKDLLFSFDEMICYISRFFKIQQGDYLFTGTPAGVGPVKPGDMLEGFIGDKKMLTCQIK